MAYRKERLSHFVRDVVSDAIANRLSDPRVSRFTSVTRVEVSPDMKMAHVYISVMGDEGESRSTMKGLESARGMIQTRLAKQLNIRQCPGLRFHLDVGIKKALETFRIVPTFSGESGADAPEAEPADLDEMDDEDEGSSTLR